MSVNLHLHNIVIESLSNPHPDIPDDTDILAQLIIDQSIFLQTLTAKKKIDLPSWKLKVDCNIPAYACYFSIAIVRVSASKGTRLLGSIETCRREILGLIERKECLSLHLVKVNTDGPFLKLTAGFTAVRPTSNLGFYQMDTIDTQSMSGALVEFSSLKSEMILPRLREIHENVRRNIMSVDTLEMSVMYERILLLPATNEKKPGLLNVLGDVYRQRYETSQEVSDLNQAVCAYYDAIRDGVHRGPMDIMFLCDLGSSLTIRFERLGDLSDINKSIAMKEDSVQLTPDGHPDKPSLLKNLGNLLFRRFEQLGDLSDINKSIAMFEDAVQLTPDGHPDKPSLLNNLSNLLLRRFERLGDFDAYYALRTNKIAICA